MKPSGGNVAEIYATPPIETIVPITTKKEIAPWKTIFIVVRSALVTFLLGVSLLIVFK